MEKHFDIQSHDLHPHVETNHGYYLDSNASVTLLQKERYTDLQAKSGVQSNALSQDGQYLEFDIPSSEGDRIREMFIKLVVRNTSQVLGSTQLVPAPLMIQRIRIYCQDLEVEEILGESLWTDLIMYNSDEVLNRLAKVNGFDPLTFLSNNDFVEGETKTFFIPIANVLTNAKIPIKSNNVRWRVRVEMNGGARLIDDVAPAHTMDDFTVIDTTLRFISAYYDGEVRRDMAQGLVSRTHDYRYMEHRFFTLNSGSVTGGTNYSETINQTGDLSHMFLMHRPANPQGADIYSPLRLDRLDMNNSGGVSQTGHIPEDLSHDFLQYVLSPHYFPSRAFSESNIYALTWNMTPTTSMTTQGKYGSLFLDSQHRLAYRPTVTTNNTEILVLGHFYSMLSINFASGKVELHKSE